MNRERGRTSRNEAVVKSFWEGNPVGAAAVPFPRGSREYFDHYDMLREQNESPAFSEALHEYTAFAGKRVLDVGCGNGYVAARYARAGAMVEGVDITQTAVDLCRRRFALDDLSGRFTVASATALPFADGVFDCLCSMGVVHHIPEPERAIAEFWRVLRPGGRLILMLYYRGSALYRVRFALESLMTGKTRAQLVDEVDGVGNPHGRVYSRHESRELLRGFEVTDSFVRLLQPWMITPRGSRFVPGWMLPRLESRFGWFLYVKAVKPISAQMAR